MTDHPLAELFRRRIAVLDGAMMLAMTASALFRSPSLVEQVKAEFTEGVRV